MLFFLFIPATLAAALVFLPDLRQGFFFVTAMSLNWAAGGGELLPAARARPDLRRSRRRSRASPTSAATHLQATLLEQRQAFLADPAGGAQSIGAFASLHTSIFFTAALAAHLLGLGRAREGGGVDPVRADGRRDDPPRLALRRRRPGRHGHRRRWRSRSPALISGYDPRAAREPARPCVTPAGDEPVARRLAPASRWRPRPSWPASSRPAASGCRCAIPTTSRRSTSGSWASASRCSSASTSGSARRAPACAAVARGAGERAEGALDAARARLAVGGALVGFYATYMAYRNLKSIVPLLRPDDLFDRQLADLDRDLFLGHDPAALLHTLLGTGVTTHVLSAAYVAFIVFLPLTIGVALVFSRPS